MLANITLTQLRCFRAVAERGGFTAAASQLCLSQSAVSQAVAALEKSLGVPLLVRGGRDGATPTAAGVEALAEARTALAALERLATGAAAAAGSRSLTGILRVGVVQSAAVQLLPDWMRRLRSEHPGITVILHEGTDPEVTSWVLSDVAEIGVTSRTHASLSSRAVVQDDYVVVVPDGHAFANRREVALKELDGQRMLLSGGGCETLIQELLALAGSNPEIVCLVRDNATLASMVRGGLGLTIMPELALPADRHGIQVLGLRPNVRRTLHLLTKPRDALGPVALAFADMVERTERAS